MSLVGVAEGEALKPQDEGAEGDQEPGHQHDRQPGRACEGRRHQQKLAGEDPKGRQTCAGDDAQHQQPPEQRLTVREPADVGGALRPLELRDVADAEEDGGLGQAVHGHVQQSREARQRPAQAERERDDAHVLDRGIREQALDVAAPVEHETGEQERGEAHGHHHRAGREHVRIAGDDQLESQQREQRHVEQEA